MAKNSIDAYGAAGKTNLLFIDPEKLTIVENDPGHALYDPDRTNLPVDEALVLNIMAEGVIEPAIIRKNPDTEAIEVVDGRQRVKACREANKRLAAKGCTTHLVPCVPRRGDGKALMGVMISTFIRQDDTPMGRARKLARYLDLGHSEEQAAVTFGISTSTVRNLLALNDAPKAVQTAVESGKVPASVGYTLAKMNPDEAKAKLDELKTAVPKVEKGTRKAARKTREIVTGKAGMMGKRDLQALLEKVSTCEGMKEMHRAGAQAALLAALGDESTLSSLMS